MKKYRTLPAVIVLAVALLMLLNPENPRWISLVLLALAAVLVIWASRGTFTFSKANRIISQRKPGFLDKALHLYEKAVDEGVPEQYELVAGTLLIQYGNMEKGKEILESLLSSREKKMVFQAKEGLSMYYWIKKDTKKAIALCEEAKAMGLKDKNLYINLGTYYLSENRIHDFRLLIKESYKLKMDSPALIDMQAAAAIIQGDYAKAGNLLKTVFDSLTPSYVDPYIHYAMVYMYYRQPELALDYLRKSLEACSFSNTSILSREEIEKMIGCLENKDSVWAFIKSAEKNPLMLINGKLPEYTGEDNTRPEVRDLPLFKAEAIEKNDLAERDENEPDTSLNEEDEEWLRRHNN